MPLLPSSIAPSLIHAVCLLLSCALPSLFAAGLPERYLDAPPAKGPTVVRATFELLDLNAIDDNAETFEFSGLLSLTWKDERQAFDPETAGVKEKIYQGNFQFNEVSPAWYPQVFLANPSGSSETSVVLLRVLPDGTSTLVSNLNAVAKTDFAMRRFPFDRHELKAVFGLLGFASDRVVFEAAPPRRGQEVGLSQWWIEDVECSTRERPSVSAGNGQASEWVVSLHVKRQAMFTLRLVVMPLALIVILSWSVFWMDRSALGDRINLSFVGILTAVAYQIVVGDLLPHVSYVTLMHGFLNLSFFMMCAAVVINLWVGLCDKQGRLELGDRIDRACRWIFPLGYLSLTALMSVLAFVLF